MSCRPLLLLLLALGGCPTPLGPERAPCTSDAACLPGEGCVAGACVPASAAPCSGDLDCDPSAGELCVDGACRAPEGTPDSCASTADCPDDQFCNGAAGACAPLLDGWCRLPAHCEAPTPICQTDSSSRPGLCVACVTDGDCATGTCDDGACVDDAPVQCPANATLVPGSTTVCQCDAGFAPDAATASCAPVGGGGGEAPPQTECVANASPVPGIPGQCRCDGGFAPNNDGSACVPSGDAPPPEDDGDGGGVVPGEDDGTCGPNAVPIFFVCLCLPGFVVNEDGPGCVADDSEQVPTDDGCPVNAAPDPNDDTACVCDDGFEADASGTACEPVQFGDGDCPENAAPDPEDDAFCVCDPGFVVDGAACVPDDDDGCPDNSSPDPFDDGACLCDDGFVVNAGGTACVVDTSPECPENSIPDPTDDAFCICDEGFIVVGTDCVDAGAQCPPNSSPDGDLCRCDAGFVVNDAGTACVEDICEANGFYGDGEFCDDFCPFADPDCA